MELRSIYYCKKCKNLVELTSVGGGTLVCCGEPMILLEANTEDAANEKHVPVVESTAKGIKVTVGSVEHPMIDTHWIEFIEVLTEDGVYRKELKPGMAPVAEFNINIDEVIEVREFCNLHMLWSYKK
ncbi:MAG: desulfoferrodoxin [Candidatus Cloacimonadales bacterium]|jgi:superoxide reductase|nr:desulfoferrodoxin [Candidatus Cloacimonadota bacterium]MDD2649730.1 desulfoferrodoxin [Candidatus Cloacimonadota bacterium]MDX9977307.1 desulfoferrodoxin [Candidatus Cloacimonadales bacterium]